MEAAETHSPILARVVESCRGGERSVGAREIKDRTGKLMQSTNLGS